MLSVDRLWLDTWKRTGSYFFLNNITKTMKKLIILLLKRLLRTSINISDIEVSQLNHTIEGVVLSETQKEYFYKVMELASHDKVIPSFNRVQVDTVINKEGKISTRLSIFYDHPIKWGFNETFGFGLAFGTAFTQGLFMPGEDKEQTILLS